MLSSTRLFTKSALRAQLSAGRALPARLRASAGPARLTRPNQRRSYSSDSDRKFSGDTTSPAQSEGSALSWVSGLLIGIGTVAASATVAFASADQPDETVKSTPGNVLPLSTIRQLISRHEQIHFPPKRDDSHVEQVQISWYAANSPVEDTHRVAHHGEMDLDGGSLFGVFDGHSGTATSAFCRDELFNFLSWHLTHNAKPGHDGDFSQLLSPQAFIDADNAFLTLNLEDGKIEEGRSGACVNVVHVRGDQITVANAGDCRAVIGRESSSGIYQAVALSMDHQIDFNQAESDRLQREHPNEPDIIAKNRVKGRLQPTRGMGDGPYKRIEYFWPRQDLADRYAQTGWNPPYTTAKPDIKHHRLRPDDRFLVLATDGLFQDLDSHQVVKYVGEYLRSNHNMCPPEGTTTSADAINERVTSAASYLVEKALLHAAINEQRRAKSRQARAALQGAVYNSEFLSASSEHELLSAIVQLPPAAKRNVHDDTTVLVLLFKELPHQHHDWAHSQLAKGSHEDQKKSRVTPAPTPLTPFLARWIARSKQ